MPLDHLRALAAYLVFVWHLAHQWVPTSYVPSAWYLSVFEEGHTGVALFMTLSGFIFTMLLDGKQFVLKDFYRNRFLRIFPLLFFWSIFATQVNGANAIEYTTSYLTLLARQGFPGSWTLIIEAQFYLLFPFMIGQLNAIQGDWKKELAGKLGLLFCFLVLAYLMRYIDWMRTGNTSIIAYITIFGRMDQFVLGAAAYYVYKYVLRDLPVYVSGLAGVAATASFMMFYHRFNQMGGYYGTQNQIIWMFLPTIEGLGYGALVACYLRVFQSSRGVISKSLSFVGTVSYGIYLNHFMLLEVFTKWYPHLALTESKSFEAYLVWTTLVAFPAVIAFSALTYYLIELPFLTMRRNYSRA